MKTTKLLLLLVAGILFCHFSFAQTHLDSYLKQGLENSETIKQSGFELEKSLVALKSAKSLFLPSAELQGDYFLADGGRTIDVPIGDLLNNVYSTLNQLTDSNNFPQLENQNELLNPNNFYDVRLRFTMPLIRAELVHNKRIKGEEIKIKELAIVIYKKELVRDIKVAYFNYLKAQKATEIYEQNIGLLEKNLRVNESLLKNGKATRLVVVRSQNEISQLKGKLEAAKQQANSAKAYFNFLLNRELDAAIQMDSLNQLPPQETIKSLDVSKREELKQLYQAQQINTHAQNVASSYLIPQLSTFMDVGSQGFDGNFNQDTRYYFLGLSLRWNIFSGQRNKYAMEQSKLDQEILLAKTSYAERQLELQLQTTLYSFQNALAQYEAALQQQHTASIYYQDISRLYREGTALHIELLDAQKQLTTAQLQVNISLFDTWIQTAQIERSTASFSID